MPTQNPWAWVGMGMGTQCRALLARHDTKRSLKNRTHIWQEAFGAQIGGEWDGSVPGKFLGIYSRSRS